MKATSLQREGEYVAEMGLEHVLWEDRDAAKMDSVPIFDKIQPFGFRVLWIVRDDTPHLHAGGSRMRFGCLTAVIAIPTVAFGLLVLSNPYLRAWTGRVLFQTDRVIVLNGHGFRVPGEYPGFNYGGATGGLATAVLWPSMEPWRSEATKNLPPGVCGELELHLSAHDPAKPLQLEAQFAEEARNAKLERKNFSRGLDLVRWDEVDREGRVWHEVYENRKDGIVDFIARCKPPGRSIYQSCTVFQSYNDNVDLTMEGISIDCLKNWRVLRGRANGLLEHFEDLYAKHK